MHSVRAQSKSFCRVVDFPTHKFWHLRFFLWCLPGFMHNVPFYQLSAELQTNDLIFRPLILNCYWPQWPHCCSMSDSVDVINKSDILLSYLQLQLVLTVLHNKTNKRVVVMSIAISRKKISKIQSSLVHFQAIKTAIKLNFSLLTWRLEFI